MYSQCIDRALLEVEDGVEQTNMKGEIKMFMHTTLVEEFPRPKQRHLIASLIEASPLNQFPGQLKPRSRCKTKSKLVKIVYVAKLYLLLLTYQIFFS